MSCFTSIRIRTAEDIYFLCNVEFMDDDVMAEPRVENSDSIVSYVSFSELQPNKNVSLLIV